MYALKRRNLLFQIKVLMICFGFFFDVYYCVSLATVLLPEKQTLHTQCTTPIVHQLTPDVCELGRRNKSFSKNIHHCAILELRKKLTEVWCIITFSPTCSKLSTTLRALPRFKQLPYLRMPSLLNSLRQVVVKKMEKPKRNS